jgi:hypothetical protein
LAYININKRVRKLAKGEYLEQLKPVKDLYTLNIHGRKDYKITMKGMRQLIPYIMNRENSAEKVVEYMDKVGLDKEGLGISVMEEINLMHFRIENLVDMAIAVNQSEFFDQILGSMHMLGILRQEHREYEPLGKKDSKTKTQRKQLESKVKLKRKSNS